jgi:hypothetical protein
MRVCFGYKSIIDPHKFEEIKGLFYGGPYHPIDYWKRNDMKGSDG